MTALIEKWSKLMSPLLAFRNRLADDRNISENRSSTRRNGSKAVDETGHNFVIIRRYIGQNCLKNF